MPPQEKEPQEEQQDGNTAVEVAEITPKRRKIQVNALVHATDVIYVPEEREINIEAVQEILEAPVVGEPQKGYTCTGCRPGVVMVDEDTSTSDLMNPEKGITIKRRCVKCLAIKLAVDVSTSTTDLEAAAEEARSNEVADVATSTTNLIEAVLSTAEAATSTTDLNVFEVESLVSHQKVVARSALEMRGMNCQVTPSFTEVLSSNNRKSVVKAAEKLKESRKSLRSSAVNKLSSFERTPRARTNVEAVPCGETTERHLSLRSSSNHRMSGTNANKLAASEELHRTSNNFEAVPSGGELHEASACERKMSLRSSSNHRLSGTNANKLAAEKIHRTSNNLEVVPSGGELLESFASQRQMSLRSSFNHRLSAPEKTPHRTSNNFEAVPSERQMSFRSSSNHRMSAKNSSKPPPCERSNTNIDAAPSASSSVVAAESNEAPTLKQRTETIDFTPVDLSTLQQSNVNKKKKAPRKQKQADTTESVGTRRSTRTRKPTALPFSIVVAANTRFLHSVNKNDYYKHENTDQESISKFVAPYLRSSLINKMKPKKSSNSNVSAGITITEQETTRKSIKKAVTKQRSTKKRTSVRKTQNRRESPFSAKNEQVFFRNSSADLDTTRADDNVSSVTNSEEKHVCGAAPELKKVKNNGDLAMGICFSNSENTGLKSGYLEIVAGGEKLESSTRNKIVYTVWQGGADVCINGKRDRVKKGGEFIVKKGLAYSIRNVSKQNKLTLHFLKIFG